MEARLGSCPLEGAPATAPAIATVTSHTESQQPTTLPDVERGFPRVEAKYSKQERIEFLENRKARLQKQLESAKHSSGSMYETSRIADALTAITSELSELRGPLPAQYPDHPVPQVVKPPSKPAGELPRAAPSPLPTKSAPTAYGESRPPRIRIGSNSFSRIRRRIRIKRSTAFLLMWAGTFFTGLLLVPESSLVYLVVEALVNAVGLFVLIYGILGIFHPSTSRKVLAVLLTLLVIGAVYQNPSLLSTRTVVDLFEWETSQLTSLVSSAKTAAVVLTTTNTSNENSYTSGGAVGQTTSASSGTTTSSQALTSTATTAATSEMPSPVFVSGEANIWYPPDYTTLINYALSLINRDRTANGLSAVTLSNVPSGQQHADSMLYFGYFSHWDTQGYKPYMRYTLLGGNGAVAENIGQSTCTDSAPESTLLTVSQCNVTTIENGLAASEWSMMNNDATCCNNGHRNNILNPIHNAVSIGVAYNTTTSMIYFVEDFENTYINLQKPIYFGGVVTLSGTTTRSIQPYEVVVTYDTIHPWNISALDNTFSYDSGTTLGAVFAPCPAGYTCSPTTSNGGIAAYASEWSYSAGRISLRFSLSSFIQEYGNGVYTLYLWDNQNDMLTSLSVFVDTQ